MRIAFTVGGKPVPKQRARAGRGGRHYTPHSTRVYEHWVRSMSALAVHRAAALRGTETVEISKRGNMISYLWGGPVKVEVHIYWPDRRTRDGDNVYKSIADALQPARVGGVRHGFGVLRDDSQIREHHIFEHLDRERPRAEVVVETIESDAA